MENLNAEQIKKALECCSSSDGVSACESGCPYWGGDYDTCPCIEEPNFIIKNALALINSQEQRIKELTEENERLRAQNETLEIYNADYKFRNKELTAFNRRWAKECADLQDECEQIKAKTVRKMQEMVKRRASTVGNSYANGETVIIQYCISPQALDQIAKEMLEGDNEN